MLGCLKKMTTGLSEPVRYQLVVGDELIDLNSLLGKKLALRYTGRIFCVYCGTKTTKSFNQGYCYRCFASLAQCDLCIVKPETCHYADGSCREPAWGERYCFQPHVVYLANSSGIKVGITRDSQIPTRWIDQGAVQALPVFQVASRYLSGLLEVALAKQVSDKTSWQKMLKNNVDVLDLKGLRDDLLDVCRDDVDTVIERFGADSVIQLTEAQVVDLKYPVLDYPNKINSFNFDKQSDVGGILLGIKGQYLLFDTGVINIRKFSGYEIEFDV